ncbi:hypothetical protein E8L90_06395 [Brevibacillus antibioticus]|uniref:DUF4878 domain-containing protein n=1 Tax=Brevibacillus antibioticus TaxID=2570228 RepID=A0A4U2Y4X6_9BACL|nr:hypothetical protein [Brevibacillus antibioticus]TKI55115.1 hypothetical protein E8L90_06395 [Brevibacillus antibioticus]
MYFLKFKEKKSILLVFLIALVIACISTYTFWYDTPEKTLDRYLSLVINKQGEESYDLVYKDKNSYFPDRGDFIRSAQRTQLIDYKLIGSANDKDSLAEVKVLLKFKKSEREKTFTMKKTSGQWYVVLKGPDEEQR